MLHRLETTDRPTELNSILGVVDGHIEAPLRRADLFGRQRDEREVRCAGKELRGTTVCSDQLRRCAVELHPRHLAGAVESGQRRATKPLWPGTYREQRHARVGDGRRQDDVRGVTVDNERRLTTDPMTGAPAVGPQRHGIRVPRAELAVEDQRRGGGTVDEPRNEPLHRRVVLAGENGLRRQRHGGEEGEHTSARPISSNTTASSTTPAPAPPHRSGTTMPCSPNSPAIWRHDASSYPMSVAISLRTVSLGDVALK